MSATSNLSIRLSHSAAPVPGVMRMQHRACARSAPHALSSARRRSDRTLSGVDCDQPFTSRWAQARSVAAADRLAGVAMERQQAQATPEVRVQHPMELTHISHVLHRMPHGCSAYALPRKRCVHSSPDFGLAKQSSNQGLAMSSQRPHVRLRGPAHVDALTCDALVSNPRTTLECGTYRDRTPPRQGAMHGCRARAQRPRAYLAVAIQYGGKCAGAGRAHAVAGRLWRAKRRV